MVAYYTTGNYKKLSKIVKATRNFKKIYILNIESILEKSGLKKANKDIVSYILAEQIKVLLKTMYLSKKYSSIIVINTHITELFFYEFLELCKSENIYFTQHILYDHDDSIDIKLYNLFDFVM